MRIGMFMPGLGPDALGWKVHLDFAAAVERAGHRFLLLTTPAARPSLEARRAAWPAADVPGTTPEVLAEPPFLQRLASPARPLLRTRQLLPAAGALSRYLKARGGELDILHLEVAYPHGAAGTLAALWSGWKGPIAVTPMGEDILVVPERSYGMRRYPVPAALVRWTLRRAAAVRCISPLAEEQVALLAPSSRRRVIPLSIDADAAAAAGMSAAERERFRRESRAVVDAELGTAGRPLVLSFGRLHPFKGIDHLIAAAARIGDATVLIVGPSLAVRPFGDMATFLRRRAEEIGVAEKVVVAGAVHPSRALALLAAADVVVVPSPLESLNKVCIEAAAVGTPFVVTETTGIAAWVPDEGVGIVVPPSNPAALAWAIDEVLERHFRIDAARAAELAGRFTPDRIAAEVLEFYEAALESAG
jgi:glycosyltransferase involved in cell wall biosynthesis